MMDGCPQLEELYIHHIYIEDRDEEFNIHTAPHYIAHNIKKLTVCYNNDVQAPRILSIYTPNLVYLDYSDYLTCLYNSENHFNDLLEARLDLAFARAGRWGDEHDTCLKIMNSITNVQILHLSCFTVEVCLSQSKFLSFFFLSLSCLMMLFFVALMC